jgi:hypothetical protein
VTLLVWQNFFKKWKLAGEIEECENDLGAKKVSFFKD